MQRKALSLILILCLLLGVLPNSLAAPAAAAERSPLVLQVVKEGVDENDDGGLLKALKDVERLGPAYGVATIEIGSDITLTKPAVFPSNIDIILRSVTGKHYTIKLPKTGALYNDVECPPSYFSGGFNVAKQKENIFASYPDVVNVEQLCTMLGGIGRKTAYGLLKGGSIRYLKIGKSFKIPKVAVIEYLIDTN